MNEEGIPFNIVFDSILETKSVKIIPKSTTSKTHNVDTIEETVPTKKTSYKYSSNSYK